MRNLSRMAAQLEKKDKIGVGCLALFALPFAAVGVVAAVWLGRSLITWTSAQGWEETPAYLTSVDLKEHSGDDSTTHEVVATYDYEFLGQRYAGNRVGISSTADNIGHWQKRVYADLDAHFRRNQAVPCYVNPRNPSEALLNRELRWEMVAFQSVFAVAFGLVGFGLLIGSLFGIRRTREQKASQAEHPSEPWRWNPEWAQGVIRAGSKGQMVGMLVFTVLWNAISMPLLFILPREISEKGNRAGWIGFLFPLVGVGLIVGTIRSVIRWVRFGKSTFQMAAVPGVIGGRVAGIVTLPRGVQPANGFVVTLNCLETVTTGSGKNRSTKERTLWQDSHIMRAEPMRTDPMLQALPVLFAVPYELPSATPDAADGKVTWRLEVTADIPGIDYLVQFEIPVFKTAASSRDFKLDPSSIAKYEVKQDPARTLRDAKLVLTQTTGGTSIVFPMCMRPGQALGVTAFFLLWTGIVVFLAKVDAPKIFPIIFGIFDLLLFYATLDAWLGSARIDVKRGTVCLQSGLFGSGAVRELPGTEIDRIESAVGPQQGTAITHLVRVHMKDGKTHDAGRPLARHLEAGALADVMRLALQG